ncbi:hypothetical protein [Fibrella aestuarina]|nr:hypothetical protein [Fibrella aestuarina]
MHELLDELQVWITDFRSELPPYVPLEATERVSHTRPIQSLGQLLKTLKTTPVVPQYPPLANVTTTPIGTTLAYERLDYWVADIGKLDPDDLDAWDRHRAALMVFVQNGHSLQAAEAMELLLQHAATQYIGYDRYAKKKKFFYLPFPDDADAAT